MNAGRRLALLSAACLLAACPRLDRDWGTEPTSPAELPKAQASPDEARAFLAGFGREVITPPPGVPLGGHAKESATGVAAWGELEARAIYLRAPDGGELVLVACDLWAVSGAFVDRVVAQLAREHGIKLRRESLSIGATHTHHGPGNFAGEAMYNSYAQARAGFDPVLEAFLVERVARSIVSARAAARAATLELDHRVVEGVARNRSILAFMAAPESASRLEANAGLAGCGPAPELPEGPDRCHAIDPRLRAIRVRDLEGRLLGLVATMAVHPVAMPREVDAYHGDLFAIARSTAEAQLAAADRRPLVVLFNGPEGDVSPNWDQQSRKDTEALGRRLGLSLGAIAKAPESGAPLAPTLEHRHRRVRLPEAEPEGHAVAARAIPGRAMFAGAEDGRTKMQGRRNREGAVAKRERVPGQGLKLPAIGRLWLAIGLPPRQTPEQLDLVSHRIGGLTLASMPGEFTTNLGQRLRAGLHELAPGEPEPMLLGLTDGYGSYFTTPEGYATQQYEGGSTLFGPWSGPALVAAHLEAWRAPATPLAPAESAHAGPRRRFWLRPGPRAKHWARVAARVLFDQLEIEDGAPHFDFDDRFARPDDEGHVMPELWLDVPDAEGHWRPARRGLHASPAPFEFVRSVQAVEGQTLRWRGIWLGRSQDAELGELRRVPGGAVRLHARGVDGREHCSAPFSPGEPVPERLETRSCAADPTPPPDPRENLG